MRKRAQTKAYGEQLQAHDLVVTPVAEALQELRGRYIVSDEALIIITQRSPQIPSIPEERQKQKFERKKMAPGTRSRAAVSVAESKPHYPQTHKTQKTQKFCVLFFCVEFLSANRINSADTQTHKKAAEEIRDEI